MNYNILDEDYELTTNEETNILIIDFDKILECKVDTNTYNQFLKNILKIFSN